MKGGEYSSLSARRGAGLAAELFTSPHRRRNTRLVPRLSLSDLRSDVAGPGHAVGCARPLDQTHLLGPLLRSVTAMSLVKLCQLYLSVLLHYHLAALAFVMRLGYIATVYLPKAEEGQREISDGEPSGRPVESEPAAAPAPAPAAAPAPARKSSFLSALRSLLTKTMAPVSAEEAMRKDKESEVDGAG